MSDRLGSISAGKIADFVVREGDPLTDIEILGDRRAVSLIVQDGEVKQDSLE